MILYYMSTTTEKYELQDTTDLEKIFDQILYSLDLGILPLNSEFELIIQDNDDLDLLRKNIENLKLIRGEFNFHFDLIAYSQRNTIKLFMGVNDHQFEKSYKIKLRLLF